MGLKEVVIITDYAIIFGLMVSPLTMDHMNKTHGFKEALEYNRKEESSENQTDVNPNPK